LKKLKKDFEKEQKDRLDRSIKSGHW
jgi:hypothetical protein